jgi:hypothetical protein
MGRSAVWLFHMTNTSVMLVLFIHLVKCLQHENVWDIHENILKSLIISYLHQVLLGWKNQESACSMQRDGKCILWYCRVRGMVLALSFTTANSCSEICPATALMVRKLLSTT